MTLFKMTPEQVTEKLINERLKVSDNAKELERQELNRRAEARRANEDKRIDKEYEKAERL